MFAIGTVLSAIKANPIGLGLRALPYVIAAGALVYGTIAAYDWAYDNGYSKSENKWLEAEKTQHAELVAEIERLNREDKQAAQDSLDAQNKLSTMYQTEIKNAKKHAESINAKLRSELIRLRDPFPSRNTENHSAGASVEHSDSSRRNGGAGGELSVEASQFLLDLTFEADEVARQITYLQGLLRECEARWSGAEVKPN